MSSHIFPTELAGLGMRLEREVLHDVVVQESVSGKELRSSWWSSPRYRYRLSFDFLRTATYRELASLVRFVSQHFGQLDSFLLLDPEDHAADAHGFGVGDGQTETFQLQRSMLGHVWDTIGKYALSSVPRINRLTYSDAINQWTATNASAASSTAAAPIAGSTAYKVTESTTSSSQVVDTYSTPGTYSWVPPYDVTSVTVQLWGGGGGGGGGGGDGGTGGAAGGGGGGGYLSRTLTVSPGTALPVVVGAGGAGGAAGAPAGAMTSGEWGESSKFGPNNLIIARGGGPGGATGGAGGDTWGYADASYVGGSGYRYDNDYTGGGGGGSAGTASDGNSATSQDGATAVTGGGRGGNSGGSVPPTAPGGGGGGGSRGAQGSGYGGVAGTAGANGKVVLTYTTTVPVAHSVSRASSSVPTATCCASVFAKRATGTRNLSLAVGSSYVVVDLAAGEVLASSGVVDCGVYPAAGGWWRVWMAYSNASATPTVTTGLASGSSTSYAGDGTSAVYLWGAQLEAGSEPTGRIATSAAQVMVSPYYWPDHTDGFEPVYDVGPDLQIFADGVLVDPADYTVSATGLVTFDDPPADHAVLTWSGTYYRRVRFSAASLSVERMVHSLWKGGSIDLVSVKP